MLPYFIIAILTATALILLFTGFNWLGIAIGFGLLAYAWLPIIWAWIKRKGVKE